MTVGIEKAGVPLATSVSRELETTLGAYSPAKHQWDEGDLEDLGGGFSRNFSPVEGRDCFIVDDTVTSGTTLRETIDAIREQGGNPFLRRAGDNRGVGDLRGRSREHPRTDGSDASVTAPTDRSNPRFAGWPPDYLNRRGCPVTTCI